MINSGAVMNKLNKKSKMKTLLIMIIVLAFSWLTLYLYLMLSPAVALESCADNSGLWDKKEKKCYCEYERGKEKEICITKLAEELKKVREH